jgi:peptidyl-tRNA hydrolase, PTH1 family
MHLLVGLGNPGPKYARTRHNVGFMLVDRLAEAAGARLRPAFAGRFCEVRLGGVDVGLLEPLTSMNRSGDAVEPARQFCGVPLERLLVVHDEIDLPLGTLRLKRGGGAAGHNGLRSILERCGGAGFARLRVGVGRPPEGSVIDHVLGDFEENEGAALEAVLTEAARAAERVVVDGVEAAMRHVNVRVREA